MLLGEYNHNIDEKGRLIIPAKLREGLGDSFVICNGLEGCLFVYSQEEWNKFVAELAVGLVQIQAKAAAQQRCHLVDVLSQFVYVAGLPGVVAGGLYAARGSLIALEAYHVVGLPAVQGDRCAPWILSVEHLDSCLLCQWRRHAYSLLLGTLH